MKQQSEKHSKVLYVMLEGIGNLVLSLPAIEAIRNAGHDVSVCGKYPALDLVPTDIKAWTLDQLDNEHFDVVLLSPWSAEYIQKYGYKPPTGEAKIFEANPIDGTTHEAMLNFDLAASVDGVEVPEKLAHIKLLEIPTDPTGLGYLIPKYNYIVFANTAAPNWEKKRWGGYPELAHLLADDYKIVVMGSEHDTQFNPQDAYPKDTMFLYDLPLRQVAAILDNAEWVIGNDCGLTHIASSLGTQTIAIFGPTSTTKNAPLGNFKKPITTTIVQSKIACAPCQFETWESICEVNECMDIEASGIANLVRGEHLGQQILPHVGLSSHRPLPLTLKKPQKLAVVMRVKDAVDTIEECLTAANRIADIFCIVDNGSTDGTLEYLHEFQVKNIKKFPQIGNLSEFNIHNSRRYHDSADKHSIIIQTEGYDQPRDRQVMDILLKNSGATWGMFLDADEIISDQITRELVVQWMHQSQYNVIRFRHVHFWNDTHHYRVDPRWKPRHNRIMWRITPESTIQDDAKVHPGIVHNLKGRIQDTNYVVKHYGHIDKEKNRQRAEFYKSIDNPSMPNWSGRTYQHMIDETGIQLAKWHEDTPIEDRNFGNPSLLLVLLHAGGDMLMATPTIEKLKKETPDLEISVMGLGNTQERDFKTRQFFENNPNVHAYYDSSIDHHPTWWDARACDERDLPIINNDIQQLQQMTRFDTITIVTLQSDYDKHRIDRFALACETDLAVDEKRMRVYPTEAERADTQRGYLKMLSPEERESLPPQEVPKDRTISIHRWCGNPPKSWDYAEYKKLCEFLAAQGFRLILWDKGDPEPAIRGKKIINMQDYMDEHWTIGCSAVLMEMCALHIGADSLPMHLASAVGIPTLAIFEKTLVSVAAPLNENAVIATSVSATYAGDPEFYEKHAHRFATCGLQEVKAEHLYPILNEMGFIDDATYKQEHLATFDFKGHQVIAPKIDRFIYESVDWKEDKVMDALNHYVKPNESVFMDIGANVGRNALMIRDDIKSSIAIEAISDTYYLLNQNLKANLKGKNFRVFKCAIGDTDKRYVHLNWSSRQSGTSHLASIPEYLTTTSPQYTLDTLCQAEGCRPDLIKIDVEGAELGVLKGAEDTLKTARAIVIEIHLNHQTEAILSFLTERGFRVRYLTVPTEFSPHHIIAIAEGEAMLPFPVNCLYDPAELLTFQLNAPGILDTNGEWIKSTTEISLTGDSTYWFELLGLGESRRLQSVSSNNLPCFLDKATFTPDRASELFQNIAEKAEKRPLRVFLSFLYSETGDPIRYKGELVTPFNSDTLQAFLEKCREKGYHHNADKTDFQNVDISDSRNLPDPSVEVTRGRLILQDEIPF